MRTTRSECIEWLKGCLAAMQFLTRLPLPVRIEYTVQVFRRSVVFYPLAGLVIGLLLLIAGECVRLLLPPMPAAVLLLGIWVFVTGGLHLDGLMDTADGILSHRPREQMLEIMKDSRVGAMGVIVCVLYLLLKFVLIYSIVDNEQAGGWQESSLLFVIIPIWSRWFMTLAIYHWPYARQESGLGSLVQGITKGNVGLSTVLALVATAIMAVLGHGRLSTVTALAYACVSAWVVAASFAVVTLLIGGLLASWISRKLGGLTGDVYGALNELLEVLLLLGVVAVS